MAYTDTRTTGSPTSLAAVIGMHALAGVVLIGALSVTGVIETDDERFVAIPLPKNVPPPPPPPEPRVEPDPSPRAEVTPPLFVPEPKVDLNPIEPRIPTTDLFPDPIPPQPRPGPSGQATPGPIVPPSIPAVDPVPASPRNDPGRWVTDSDYRSSWIRRDMVGTARFRLEIAATGKVTGCSITRSTGHAPLDEATCNLIQRRAKFNPARGTEGEPVPSSFESSIVWRLPE